MKEKSKWYDKLRFYELTLVNDKYVSWWSELSLNEIKESIGKNDFVFVTQGRGEKRKEEDINTKVIRSVKEITKEQREFYRERETEYLQKKLIISKIRHSKQPAHVQRVIKRTEKRYQENKTYNQWDWYDLDLGVNWDVLMYYNVEYLTKLLEKCKKIDLVS